MSWQLLRVSFCSPSGLSASIFPPAGPENSIFPLRRRRRVDGQEISSICKLKGELVFNPSTKALAAPAAFEARLLFYFAALTFDRGAFLICFSAEPALYKQVGSRRGGERIAPHYRGDGEDEEAEETPVPFPPPPAGGAGTWQVADWSGFLFLPDSSTPPHTLLPPHL